MSTIDPQILHPYYPPGLRLSGDKFTPNDWDVLTLVSAFIGGWALIAAMTLVIVRRVNPLLRGIDQALVLWFVLCVYTLPRLSLQDHSRYENRY
jgi:hypothetical protein